MRSLSRQRVNDLRYRGLASGCMVSSLTEQRLALCSESLGLGSRSAETLCELGMHTGGRRPIREGVMAAANGVTSM
ncbi:hypothetical protein HYQ46_006512 [Verticillium longisporum]|nr:hypothetical protein HYQ46_006512 [Verticillium longisporum]